MSKERLLGKLKDWKSVECERDNFMNELSEENDRLLAEVNQLKRRAERADTEAEALFTRWKKSEDAVKSFQERLKAGAFVSVLVDGDCVPFLDELVQKGASGGFEAASLLMSAVQKFVGENVADTPAQTTVLVQVYANLNGLCQTYHNAGILRTPSDMLSFVRGFNMGHPMCDFIDAGNGKECSDEKLKERFKMLIANIHCKHVLFACSADNGYARLLTPFRTDQNSVQRVTLVKGPPFASELLSLTEIFGTFSFDNIFRTSKIANRGVINNSPPLSPNGNKIGYATIAASGTSQEVQKPSIKMPMQTVLGQPVARNVNGQRIDRPLRYSPALANVLKKRKLCNCFHLVGKCHFDKCTHVHGTKLSEEELRALVYVARQTPCKGGLACDSVQCILGHQCPFTNGCQGNDCRFPAAMHGVDTRIVSWRS